MLKLKSAKKSTKKVLKLKSSQKSTKNSAQTKNCEGSQRPETLRHSALDHSLNPSYPNEEREEISSVNADSEEPDVEEVERI